MLWYQGLSGHRWSWERCVASEGQRWTNSACCCARGWSLYETKLHGDVSAICEPSYYPWWNIQPFTDSGLLLWHQISLGTSVIKMQAWWACKYCLGQSYTSGNGSTFSRLGKSSSQHVQFTLFLGTSEMMQLSIRLQNKQGKCSLSGWGSSCSVVKGWKSRHFCAASTHSQVQGLRTQST